GRVRYCERYTCPCTPGVQGVDPLFEALDRGLLDGVAPEQLLQVACQTVSVLLGYPLVVLKQISPGGLRVAAGRAGWRLASLAEQETGLAELVAAGITGAFALPVRNDGRVVALLKVFTESADGFTA